MDTEVSSVQKPKRKINRLSNYDYSENGSYFVTICTRYKQCTLSTIGNIVNFFKAGVSRECGTSMWQRSYHDHVIRNEPAYKKIAEYIANNPITWQDDCHYIK